MAFNCKVCLFEFECFDWDAYIEHQIIFHKSLKVYYCPFDNCPRKYSITNSIKKHIISHIGEISDPIEHSHPATVFNLNLDINTPSTTENFNVNRKTLSIDNQKVNAEQVFDLESAVTDFIINLYSNLKLPRSTCQEITNKFLSVLTDTLKSCRSLENIDTYLSKIDKDLKFATSEKRFFSFLKNKTLIVPETLIFEKSLVPSLNNETADYQYKEVTHSAQLVRLRSTFQILFNETSIIQIYEDFENSLKNERKIVSFLQSELWKKMKSKFYNPNNKTLVLPNLIYEDCVEPNNPLGSHKCIQKIGAFYSYLPILPPDIASRLNFIFLALLYFNEDRVKFKNAIVFKDLIEELNHLAFIGIPLTNNKKYDRVVIITCLLLGDNEGLNRNLGFNLFSANVYCRFCYTPKVECQKICSDSHSIYRTRNSYSSDLKIMDSKLTGVQEDNIFNTLQYFHVTDNPSVDSMHDVFEGVCPYIFHAIFLVFVPQSFTIKKLNSRIEEYIFPFIDNRPPLFNIDCIKKPVKMSASEWQNFTIHFAFIIGDSVDRQSDAWKLYLCLRNLIDICIGTHLDECSPNELDSYIQELNRLYLKVSGSTLKPKFHHLIHYKNILTKIGLIRVTNCMRFEAKHKEIKSVTNSCNNRINILKTVATKMLLKQADFLLNFEKNIKLNLVLGRVVKNSDFNKLKYKITSQNDITIINFIEYNNVSFRNGVVVALDFDCQDIPILARIDFVIKHKKNIYLCLNLLKILYFNHDFHAFEVKKDSKFFTINFREIKCIQTSILTNIDETLFVNWNIYNQ